MKSVALQHKYTVKHKNTAIFPFRLHNICTISNITLYFFISYYSVFYKNQIENRKYIWNYQFFYIPLHYQKKNKN